MSELQNARETINQVDKEMARLFELRMDAVKQVASYKKENGLPIDDFGREDEIVKRNAEYISNQEYRAYYVNFLKNNIKLSKDMQHKLLEGMKVAYSGVEGAFANIAARRIFPDANCLPYSDFKSAYRAVEKGECDCVILPIENSFNGDVGQVMDLAFFGPLYINGVYDISVIHNLLANKGAEIAGIKEVISHPQALGQCNEYIKKHGFKMVEAVNTAVAAKEAAENAAEYLENCMKEYNSSGGVIECKISGVPAGLGEPCFEKLSANLGKAILSIGAVKGFEIGDGFAVAQATGLTNNDAFYYDEYGTVQKKTNHAGGILGGISDGSEIVFRAAVKPTPSVFAEQETINQTGENISINIKGRHDPVIVPRAVVVVESMAAITILDALLVNMSAKVDNLKKFYGKL